MRFFFTCIFFTIYFLTAKSSFGSHVQGSELTYSCIGPNQYQVKLIVLRDCDGISMPTSFTVDYASTSCSISSSFTVTLQSFQDITDLCPSQTSLCAGGNSPYGSERYIYAGILTLPNGCGNFVLSTSTCCRNGLITNITNPDANEFYISTTINNTTSPCNSSPVFASNSVIATCVNQAVTFQQLATDADGDVLVYSLVNCKQDASTSVTYAGGFSGTNPLTNPISINSATGDISFTATTPQVANICVRVEEYRSSVKIGEIYRDIQLYIINCSNQIPNLSGINGVPGVYSITKCQGSNFCFDINGTDANAGDNVTMQFVGSIPGSTFNVTGTGNNKTARFCWTPSSSTVGTFNFSVVIRDNSCPIPGQNSRTYTINIIPNPNAPINAGVDVSICNGQSTVLTATSAATNITSYAWIPVNNLSSTTTSTTTASPTTTTDYTVTATYSDGCSSSDNVRVTIQPDPVANISVNSVNVCAGGSVQIVGNSNTTGMNFQWFDPSMVSLGTGTVSGTTSTINIVAPSTSGTYNYTMRVTNPTSGCVSQDVVSVIVGSPPALQSCTNIYVSPTGTGIGTQASPANLANAINFAACQNAVLKLAIGTYTINNPLYLSSYLTIEGGFDPANSWTKTSQPGATTINRSNLNLEGTVGAQRIVAFYGNTITNFRFQDITITTSNATNGSGTSNYGVHLTNCSNYYFIRTQILTGNAGSGANGIAGTAGNRGGNGGYGTAGDVDDQEDAGTGGGGGGGGGTTVGGNGGNASGNFASANNCTLTGGTGGAGGTTGGGAGGTGASDVNGCGCCAVGNAGAAGAISTSTRSGGGGGGGASGGEESSNGGIGGNGGGVSGTYGANATGGGGGAWGDPGNAGGTGSAGVAGIVGATGASGAAGMHTTGFWVPGSQGATGGFGSGGQGGKGGGGGGGQYCTFCVDGSGNGGGGGGGGGQGGVGGTGGSGGGSSYGIYLFNNGAGGIIDQSRIVAGTAGAGGTGGTGGAGGAGGTGGAGSTYSSGEIGRGGNGGNGGAGGAGGTGGTGQAGQSINIHLQSGSALSTNNSAFNLAGQQVINVSNVNCTNYNVTYTSAAPAAWDFDVTTNNATPGTAGATSPVVTQYTQIGRYNIGMGANSYLGFHNIAFQNTIIPDILTSLTPIGTDTFQICQGQYSIFESLYPASSYNWNFNGAVINPGSVKQTPAQQFNTPGLFPITLNLTTDCCGLSPTETIYLLVTRNPTVTGSGGVSICSGQSTTLTLSGLTATDSVVWSPSFNIMSSTNNSITVKLTSTTTYIASIYSKNTIGSRTLINCPISISFPVTVNSNPVINLLATPVICSNDGTVSASIISGGNSNFSWSNGASTLNATSSNISSLTSGTYILTVTRVPSGCSITDTAFVYPGPSSPNIYLQSSTSATCGNNNGSATVNTSGGIAPYSYSWSSGGTGNSRTNLAAGNYCVTVTDGNSCTSTVCFDITSNGPVDIHLHSSSAPFCQVVNDGTATVEAHGGTGNYNYLWSNGETGPTAIALPSGTNKVVVTDANGCKDSINIVFSAPNTISTAPTITSIGTICPNTTVTLTASGGTAGTGSLIYWYSGPNGTGSLLGTGNSINLSFVSNTTIYARREGLCNTTTDASLNINVRNFIYAADNTVTNTYCTDNAGWHHFYVGNDIIFSIQGNLSAIPPGFPIVTIRDNGAYYQQSQGVGPSNCLTGLNPGEEQFEMERNWNVNLGGGTPSGSYNVRFYHLPSERTAVEAAAINWIATYPLCAYTYKYPLPLGFYWFKNNSGNYTAPQYDGAHFTGTSGSTSNSINYIQLNSISSFSGGTGGIILITDVLLPVELFAFTGTTDGNVNYLQWSTATEQNAAYFEIQRSIDGVNFESIGMMKANGFSNVNIDYNFIDETPSLIGNYYRLKIVDNDSSFSYSAIIFINRNPSDISTILYPNPVNEILNYQFNNGISEITNIEIIDITGRVVHVEQYSATIGLNIIKINTKTLADGVYSLKIIKQSTGRMYIEKFIKSK